VTCVNNLSGSGKYGFECSPQNIAGALLGTLTAGTNNKLVGAGKYVTHTLANTTTNSWTFSWTAPSASIGTVTFYAAFARGPAANVAKTSLTVTKASGMSIESPAQKSQLTISPNPSQGRFRLDNLPGKVDGISVYSTLGDIVFQATPHETTNGTFDLDLDKQKPGTYYVRIKTGTDEITKKVVIR
jgi:hypothetical protein